MYAHENDDDSGRPPRAERDGICSYVEVWKGTTLGSSESGDVNTGTFGNESGKDNLRCASNF